MEKSNVQNSGSLSPEEAASIKLQAWWRSRRVGIKIIELIRANHQRVWDHENECYYYYNIQTGESKWELALLKGTEFEPRDSWAARAIQQVWWRRKQRERRKVVSYNKRSLQSPLYQQQQQQSYDGEKERMKFDFLQSHCIGSLNPGHGEQLANLIAEQMDTSDKVVDDDDDDEEVEYLRAQLAGAHEQLESTRKELEKRISSTGNNSDIEYRATTRSKHMHHWDETQTAMWLEEIGFPKYAARAKSHGLDGLSLMNMSCEDFNDLGVTNPLHLRRLQIALQPYRLKFKDKQASAIGVMNTHSGNSYDDTAEGKGDDSYVTTSVVRGRHPIVDSNGNIASPDDEEQPNRDGDALNIEKEIIFPGNSPECQPKLGNAVKLHYVCSLEDGSVIEDSNKKRQVPFEFILGDGSVVIGMERAILTMSSGERSKFVLQSEHAYGKHEYPPIIPAGSQLVFDINLISFWQRPNSL